MEVKYILFAILINYIHPDYIESAKLPAVSTSCIENVPPFPPFSGIFSKLEEGKERVSRKNNETIRDNIFNNVVDFILINYLSEIKFCGKLRPCLCKISPEKIVFQFFF